MTVVDEPPPSARPSEPNDDGSSLNSLIVIALSAIVVAIVVLIGAVAVAAIVADDGGATGGAGPSSTEIEVSLSEFAIDGNFTVPAGDVVLDVVNDGTMEHNVILRGTDLRTPNLAPGGVAALDLGSLAPGTYELYCDVAGHEAAGMVVDLVVTEGSGGAAPAAGAGDDGGHEGFDAAAMDRGSSDGPRRRRVASSGLDPARHEKCPARLRCTSPWTLRRRGPSAGNHALGRQAPAASARQALVQ